MNKYSVNYSKELPDEIVHHIFNYCDFDLKSLVQLLRTSKRFYDIGSYDCYWKQLYIKDFKDENYWNEVIS